MEGDRMTSTLIIKVIKKIYIQSKITIFHFVFLLAKTTQAMKKKTQLIKIEMIRTRMIIKKGSKKEKLNT